MRIMYQTGFTQIPNKIIRSHKLTAIQKVVLMVLCSYANDTNIAYPSYNTIASDSGISRRKAITVIEELIQLGCIKKMKRRTSKGDNTANDYEVLIGNSDFDMQYQDSNAYNEKDKNRIEGSEYSAPPSEQDAPGGSEYFAPPSEQNTPGGSEYFAPPSEQNTPGGSEYPALPSELCAPELYIYNNIKYFNNNQSIYKVNWIDRYNEIIGKIKKQVDYDYLINAVDKDIVDEVINIMADVMTVYRPKYKIEGDMVDFEAVTNNFKMVTADKLEVCLNEYIKNTKRITNPKAYWITVLYNIPLTSLLNIQNKVNSDLFGAKR